MVMSASSQKIRILGAGVVGLTAAYEFAVAGQTVEIIDRRPGPGLGCSYFAGGMLAPWCEGESAPPLVVEWGREGLAFWSETLKLAKVNGSLLIAPARDRADLIRFSRRTSGFEWLDAEGIASREPHLAGRFDRALFYPGEAHLDPRAALEALAARLREFPNVGFRFNTSAEDVTTPADWTIDCRGFAARDALPDLRGVKGEMLVVKTDEISFQRPVQLLHPRHPVYVVPRGDGRFMVGATAVVHRAGALVTRVADYEPRRVEIDGVEFVEQLQVVAIDGGVAANVVPDAVTLTLNHRVAPDRTVGEAATWLRDYLGDAIEEGDEFTVLDAAPGAAPALENEELQALVALTGAPARAKFGWTDVATFHELGVPATNFGAGDPLLAHRSDERITLEELDVLRARLARLAAPARV